MPKGEGKKTRILDELLRILNLVATQQGNKATGQVLKGGKVKKAPKRAHEPLLTWVASRMNPAEYPSPALHDLAAYMLWINAVLRVPAAPIQKLNLQL